MTNTLKSLSETISIKRWQVLALLGMSGFAVGNILAKITDSLGF